ncbi:MAG: STAS domain-containing protein [Chloroflexi bacterium]|nr:STAS domain-containing protein [Chloroflexota bacterium]MBU1750644.1 STAS domain-containing protein [Chloroflexota bacterium]MBU1877462.1 STAS domain-containing protein [Chloroflexota bacterium]
METNPPIPAQSAASVEDQQRQRLISIIAPILILGGLLVTSTTVAAYVLNQGSWLDILGGIVVVGVGTLIYVSNRQDQVRIAGLLIGSLLILVPTYYLIIEGPHTVAVLLLLAGIVFADLLLGGSGGLVVTAINIAIYASVGLAYEFGWLAPAYVPSFYVDLGTVAATSLGLALAAGYSTREMRRALGQAQERDMARQLADERKDQLLAELQTRDQLQQRLVETIYNLGSPVMPVARGVIALPLVGVVDSQRAQQITAALLHGVAEHQATVAIVDITGVPTIDTAVAGALLQAAQGVWLLGAEPVLTGIRADVAQTLVGLGLDLSHVTTLATLQEGLEYALSQHARQTS